MLEVKTTANIIFNENQNLSKRWISEDSFIKHIEESRSPDGDYPDSECIIRDLKELSQSQDKKVVNKLWGSGKGMFKDRKEIFDDEPEKVKE